MRFFCAVIERAKLTDFLDPAKSVERIEEMGVARGQFGRFQVTAAQILVAKRAGILGLEKMKTQPATIGAGNALRLAKKSDEQEEHEIGVDPRLELEVAREILGSDSAFAVPELERSVECVVDFLDEHDEGANVAIR